MFIETSRWFRDTLESADLSAGARALDIGSSTEHFRTVEQPCIEENVMAPLRARGVEILHLDRKDDPGVDLVVDLDTERLDLAERIGRFDLVLCTGTLQNVRRPDHAIELVKSLVAEHGWLLASLVRTYPRTRDPHDSMLRPTVSELCEMFSGAGGPAFAPVRAQEVRIDHPSYYRGLKSRPSWVPVGSRWFPLPGFSERVRLAVPRWRWRESCVLMRRVNGERG